MVARRWSHRRVLRHRNRDQPRPRRGASTFTRAGARPRPIAAAVNATVDAGPPRVSAGLAEDETAGAGPSERTAEPRDLAAIAEHDRPPGEDPLEHHLQHLSHRVFILTVVSKVF